MRTILNLIVAAVLFGIAPAYAQEKKFSLYAVGFYNQENLFDTCHGKERL
mgnify:CR=1 FL=1